MMVSFASSAESFQSASNALGTDTQSTGFNATRKPALKGSSGILPAWQKLPREGPQPGGGMLTITDRGMVEALMAAGARDGISDGLRISITRDQEPASPMSVKSTHTENLGLSGNPGPETRRRLELQAKLDKTIAQRNIDIQLSHARVESFKKLRDERFHRLMENLCGAPNDNEITTLANATKSSRFGLSSSTFSRASDVGASAVEVAQHIRWMHEHQEKRRRELFNSWDNQVFQPMASQMFEHMNPPDRQKIQQLTGVKSVSFALPGETFRTHSNVRKDPVRQSLVAAARENSFHQAATALLELPPEFRIAGRPRCMQRSASLPTMSQGGNVNGPLIPAARQREMFHPTLWGQLEHSATLVGSLAQAAEQPFHRALRTGADVFLPDESDGVPAAGTKISRVSGYNDKGVLRGQIGRLGETSEIRTADGGLSCAPGQDHYHFPLAPDSAALEFPLGKRIFPQFH